MSDLAQVNANLSALNEKQEKAKLEKILRGEADD